VKANPLEVGAVLDAVVVGPGPSAGALAGAVMPLAGGVQPV
jgi:hypothetical protein